MKFTEIKRFQGNSIFEVVAYLRGTLAAGIRDLFAGLSRLRVEDNLDGWLWSGTIGASQTVAIKNEIGSIPSGRIILRAKLATTTGGTIAIDDSASEWTEQIVYLRNNGTASASVKVFFLR